MGIAYKPQPITVDLLRRAAKAEAPDRPREIRDSKGSGLVLRHEPTGRLNFYVQLDRRKRARPFGKRCDARRVLDGKPTLETVKTEARRLLAAYDDGIDIAADRRAEKAIPTLTEYLEKHYESWAESELTRGAEAVDRIRKCFGKDFGNDRLTEITKAKATKWRAARRKSGIKPETINRDVGALRAALNAAVNEFELIKANPLARTKMSKVDRTKRVVRALNAEEKKRLLEALQARDAKKREERQSGNEWRTQRGRKLLPAISRFADVLTPAVVASLETGLRRGELFALEWPAVDFRHKEIHLKGETTKSYLTRSVPMNKVARDALREWWMQHGQPKTGYVFTDQGRRVKNLRHSYQKVLADAGISRINDRGDRVNWHSLRHTFGTLLGAAGVDPETLRSLMGHADLATTQRYLHSDADRRREAVELLAVK